MGKYNRLLHGIMKKYGLYKFIQSPYRPYFYTRLRAQLKVKKLIRYELADQSICIICEESHLLRLKNLFHSAHFCTIPEGGLSGGQECKDYLTSSIKDKDDVIISFAGYTTSGYINMALIDMRVKFIDIYEWLEQEAIYLCKTDFVLAKETIYKSVRFHLYSLLLYYAHHIRCLRKMGNGRLGRKLEEDFSYNHVNWINARNKYIQKGNYLSEFRLNKLIATYIDIKDFSSLFELLEGKDNWNRKNEFLDDIKGLLEKLKKDVSERKGRAVVINWLDAVSYGNLSDMPWLDKGKDEWINFRNVYTPITQTSMVFRAIMSGKLAVRDRTYKYGSIKPDDDYAVMKELYDNGYKVLYVGGNEMKHRHFAKEQRFNGADHIYFAPCTEELWNAATILAENPGEDYYLFIHEHCEGHPPCFSIDYDGICGFFAGGMTDRQKSTARSYLDKELEWYSTFFNKFTQVYMSDHGDPDLDLPFYRDERSHVLLIVKTPDLQMHSENRLFSMKDLCPIVQGIVEKNGYEDLADAYVSTEGLDKYTTTGMSNFIETKKSKDFWMQFQAIRTEKELFVMYADGECRLYFLPDEETNHASEIDQIERVQKYKDELAPFFINPYEDEYFKHTIKLYEAFNIRIERLIDNTHEDNRINSTIEYKY